MATDETYEASDSVISDSEPGMFLASKVFLFCGWEPHRLHWLSSADDDYRNEFRRGGMKSADVSRPYFTRLLEKGMTLDWP